MRFILDAPLPPRLARVLTALGHHCIHTLELADGNRTPDEILRQLAAAEDRVLITKDGDFADSFLLRGQPPKLLLVSTGNIGNRELEGLFRDSLAAIVSAFDTQAFVELDRDGLILRG
jgi:predicted nuclease of predicted toxin-antitoxin system